LQNWGEAAYSFPAMSAPLVPNDLWEAIEPLLPEEPPKPKGGRPRVPDRAALAGIVFVLRTGCPWRLLPKELGCGSGTTCWRRLRDWQEAGVWERLHAKLLDWLGGEGIVDWSRASADSLSVRAKRGARRPGGTRSTGASRARSTTWSSTATASRSPSACRPRTATTRPISSRWSTPSRPSSVHGGNRAGPGSARRSCTATRPTTLRACGAPSAPVASRRVLPAAGSTPASGWDGTGGWSSARSLGCSAAAASACATSGGPTCSRACSTWRAP
jgi:transposase